MSAEYPRSRPSEIPKEIEKFFNEKNPNILMYIKKCEHNDEFKGKQLFAFAAGAALTYQELERKGVVIPQISNETVTECNNARNKRLEVRPRDMEGEWLGEWRKFSENDPRVAIKIFNKGIRSGVEEDEVIAFQGGGATVHSLIEQETAICNVSNEIELWLRKDAK